MPSIGENLSEKIPDLKICSFWRFIDILCCVVPVLLATPESQLSLGDSPETREWDMQDFYLLRKDVETTSKRVEEVRASSGLEQLEEEVRRLERAAADDSFWDDRTRAQQILMALNDVKDKIKLLTEIKTQVEDAETIVNLTEEMDSIDGALLQEAVSLVKELNKVLDRFELTQLLSGPYDKEGAVLYITAGAGGTDAQDAISAEGWDFPPDLGWAKRSQADMQGEIHPGYQSVNCKEITIPRKDPPPTVNWRGKATRLLLDSSKVTLVRQKWSQAITDTPSKEGPIHAPLTTLPLQTHPPSPPSPTTLALYSVQDWADMLLRMYVRWGEKQRYKTKVVEMSSGEEAGIKSATVEIEGRYAYGYLSGEKGTHRIVRQSPFNAKGLRQTSFSGVEIMPLLPDESMAVEIPEDDLDISFSRAGGKGGQNVNKVETAVRITHIPTGVTVRCTEERTQLANKTKALSRLKAKLLVIAEEQRAKEIKQIRGDAVKAEWGQQIRNYIFHPYKLVKDVRTGLETSDVVSVMDGELDPFIKAYLKYKYSMAMATAVGIK
ncbi:hypothetical protein RHMOL_Rhmol09G0182800 [Rhododendron molle]|uniref:Uncharacterized protein n=1 Tax=Rhododendron molle TaxID=49168 RepID=A0ACC0MFB2_RHOML|nr:hypothetical protein RHMOL_Rhmol09G0182800 [Rhododendron molle]